MRKIITFLVFIQEILDKLRSFKLSRENRSKIFRGRNDTGSFVGVSIPHNSYRETIDIMMELAVEIEEKFSDLNFTGQWDFKKKGAEEYYFFFYK